MGLLSGSKRDKGFSSKNKVQQYHGNGSETIIMMGKPFRVLQNISMLSSPKARRSRSGVEKHSYVYLVENTARLSEFPQHLALKREFFAVDEVGEAHREIEIVSRVRDPSIVRIFHSEISRSEGRLGVSIAMEFCGNNLHRRIQSGARCGAGTRLSEAEICNVLFAVTSAVGYLHSLQPPVAHRDIRPENILINNTQTGASAYKLCNLGNASTEAYECVNRAEANLAIEDIERHTLPAYRSPEMADPLSGRRIDEKVDLWAMGVLLYQMMFNKLPFEPTNVALSSNPTVHFPSTGQYSGSLHLIVEHLLDSNVSTRWDIFTLTNFLRFDEDISRHLGVFYFTCTEWPEGWEPQDVRVINREAPVKPPPVASSARAAAPPLPDTSGPTRPRRGSGTAVGEAMAVLTHTDAESPEMTQYRSMIIQEQEEAWERAKAAAQARVPAKPASAPESEPTRVPTEPPTPTEAEAPNVLDDLFGGPAPETSSRPAPPGGEWCTGAPFGALPVPPTSWNPPAPPPATMAWSSTPSGGPPPSAMYGGVSPYAPGYPAPPGTAAPVYGGAPAFPPNASVNGAPSPVHHPAVGPPPPPSAVEPPKTKDPFADLFA